MQPSVRRALDALMSGVGAEEYSDATGLAIGSSWTAFCKAAIHADPDVLKARVRELLPPQLWRALERLKGKGDGCLGGSLTDLEEVVRKIAPRVWETNEHAISMLRLGRMVVLK